MQVCRFYSLSLPVVMAMKCQHFMAHLMAVRPLWAMETFQMLKVLVKDQRIFWDELESEASWGDRETFDSAREFYDGVAAIEAARALGGK
jgi:hypothetical protein